MYKKVTIGQAARALAHGEMVFASTGWGIQMPKVCSVRQARKHIMLFRWCEGDLLLLQ